MKRNPRPVPTSVPPPDERDNQELAAFGYKPTLARRLGRFSSFAAGFSYLSILTGLFQMFHLGFAAGGPAFVWTWPTVFVGQFMVALCFAELAARYPLSGGVYQWSKHVSSRLAGWMTGWIYLACSVVTLAAVALALQTTLPQIDGRFQLVGDRSNPTDQARNAVILGCGLITASTLIHALGVGLLARLNNLGVFAELVGVTLLIGLLAVRCVRSPGAVLFETQNKGAGEPFGYLGPFLAAAGLTASYVLYGYDTAGSLAEETTQPRRHAPRAILLALSAAGLSGGLLLLVALMAAPDLHAPSLADDAGGLPEIVQETLGTRLGTLFLWDVILAICVCTLVVHTGTVRLVFAMARDNMLPGSTTLARVSTSTHTPLIPAVVVGGLAIGLLVANVDFPNVIKVVTAVAILWANLAYLFVTAPLLVRRLRGWRSTGFSTQRGFGLGRWGLLVNLLAVAWCLFTVVNVGWPRPEVYGEVWYHRYGGLLYTGGLLILGGGYYGFVQRRKKGIVAEHRA